MLRGPCWDLFIYLEFLQQGIKRVVIHWPIDVLGEVFDLQLLIQLHLPFNGNIIEGRLMGHIRLSNNYLLVVKLRLRVLIFLVQQVVLIVARIINLPLRT